MTWRLVAVLSLLALALTAAPVTARTRLAEAEPVMQVAEPTIVASDIFGPTTLWGAGFGVTIHGGRWPYSPPMTAADAARADPSVAWLALDVSVANSCPESTGYSAGYFRLRVGDLPGEIVGVNRPVPSGDLQPALAEGTLPASTGPGLEPPMRRGWVTFAEVPVYRQGALFLDYVTPFDALGDIPLPAPQDPSACPPLRRISLPIQFR